MKIALVTWSYDRREGMGRCVVELSERLAKTHEVHVFTPTVGHQGNASIVVHRVPVMFHRWYLMIPAFFFASARLLRRQSFDLIHLHAPSYHKAHVVTCHAVPQAGKELSVFWGKESAKYCGNWNTLKMREADALVRRTLGPPLWDDAELVAYKAK